MLQRVHFFMKKRDGEKKIEKLLYELATEGILTDVVVQKEDNCMWENVLLEEKEQSAVLCVTDDVVCFQTLKRKSIPVVAYLHEENRNEDFSQAEYAIEEIEEITFDSLKLVYQRLTGQPWTILSTKRCIVRETTTNDVDAFYEIYKEPSITFYMENLYEDREEEKAYLEDYRKRVYGFYGYGIWTVLEKESGKVIGRAGISWREGYDVPELGYVIAVPFQGKGYAYEVCQAILEYGKKELGFYEYQVLIMEGNERSEDLCRKLGFQDAGEVMLDGSLHKRMLWKAL